MAKTVALKLVILHKNQCNKTFDSETAVRGNMAIRSFPIVNIHQLVIGNVLLNLYGTIKKDVVYFL